VASILASIVAGQAFKYNDAHFKLYLLGIQEHIANRETGGIQLIALHDYPENITQATTTSR
jgi:hypothetical protein